jgi:hypothetical protein
LLAPQQSTVPLDGTSPLCMGYRLITIARDPRDFEAKDVAVKVHAYVGLVRMFELRPTQRWNGVHQPKHRN